MCKYKKIFCGNEDCKKCFEKSFASVNFPLQWSHKNILTPRKIEKYSNKKFLFNCLLCKHEIEISISNITRLGRTCVYCKNQKLCTNDDCDTCFQKSFFSSLQ